jgi:mRNA-degrading endonuclease RelE of RelBE toxin-antitoxin system
MRISASDQVLSWLQGLPPEARRRVRQSLKSLATGRSHTLDLLPLRRELEGCHRLRIGDYRIVYHLEPGSVIRLDYADIRDVVYDTFRRLRAIREGRRR